MCVYHVDRHREFFPEHERIIDTNELIARDFWKANSDETPIYCQFHATERLEYYCKRCQLNVCRYCMSHSGHDMKYIHHEANKKKEDLIQRIREVGDIQQEHERSVNRIQSQKDALYKMGYKVIEDIDSYFEEVIATLKERRNSLTTIVTQLIADRRTALDNQIVKLQNKSHTLSYCRNMVDLFTKHCTSNNFMQVEQILTKRVDTLSKQFLAEQPTSLTKMHFLVSKQFTDIITTCGMLTEVNPPSCVINTTHNFRLLTNTYSQFQVFTNNSLGETVYEDYTQVECKISGPDTIKPKIIDNKDGSYIIKLLPITIGKYSITVSVNGVNVPPGPTLMIVSRNYCEIKKPLLQTNDLSTSSNNRLSETICGVACDSNDNFYATIPTSKSFKGFSPNGKCLFQISMNKHNITPYGIAVCRKGLIYVTDKVKNSLAIFADGKLLKSITRTIHGQSDLKEPMGLCTTHSDEVLVADSGNNRVVVFSSEGVAKGHFGSQLLKQPIDVAINSQNQIIVLDNGEYRLNVFDNSTHAFSFSMVSSGIGESCINNGKFIGIDRADNILVTDLTSVKIFCMDGLFLGQLFSPYEDEKLKQPLGLTVNSEGKIIVSYLGSTKISVF